MRIFQQQIHQRTRQIGVAGLLLVTSKPMVVPPLRQASRHHFAGIEQESGHLDALGRGPSSPEAAPVRIACNMVMARCR